MDRPIDFLVQAVTRGKSSRAHFLDVENLLGSGLVGIEQASGLCLDYMKSVECSEDDLFVVAAGPGNKAAVYGTWRGKNTIYKFQKGRDGADQALLTIFDQFEHLDMFEHIYVGSGDHSLAAIAEKSARFGIGVTVVTGKGALSNTLRKYRHLELKVNSHE